MMYGTVARMKVTPGHLDQLLDQMKDWDQRRRPDVKGAVASYVYRLAAESNQLMLAVVFSDKDAYFANADDPEQDKWFQELRAHLAEGPEWHDGEVIYST